MNLMPLFFQEYERLFRTIHAVVASETSEPAKACVFFSVAGARILVDHHGISAARPVAGFAGYNIGPFTPPVLAFGTVQNNSPTSSLEAFHCWIEADGQVLDLTSPLFNELVSVGGRRSRIPRRMFQKPLNAGVQSLGDLNNFGAYLHVPNPSLQSVLLQTFKALPANADLVAIAAQWYARPPNNMVPHVDIGDQRGKVSRVRLSPMRIEGTW